MPRGVTSPILDAHAYLAHQQSDKKTYKGKRPDLKCEYCHSLGHTIDRYWSLHPELKLKSGKDKKGGDQKRGLNHKAHLATHSAEMFSSNPIALLNDFNNYLQAKHGQGVVQNEDQRHNEPAAFLSKFADFLADANGENNQGIMTAFMTALEISTLHDLWVVDFGATDHVSNKFTNICDFCPSFSTVSVANGKKCSY